MPLLTPELGYNDSASLTSAAPALIERDRKHEVEKTVKVCVYGPGLCRWDETIITEPQEQASGQIKKCVCV